jgi:hypothetical protein
MFAYVTMQQVWSASKTTFQRKKTKTKKKVKERTVQTVPKGKVPNTFRILVTNSAAVFNRIGCGFPFAWDQKNNGWHEVKIFLSAQNLYTVF